LAIIFKTQKRRIAMQENIDETLKRIVQHELAPVKTVDLHSEEVEDAD